MSGARRRHADWVRIGETIAIARDEAARWVEVGEVPDEHVEALVALWQRYEDIRAARASGRPRDAWGVRTRGIEEYVGVEVGP